MIVWWVIVGLGSAFLGWRLWQRYDRYRRAMRRRTARPVAPARNRYASVRSRNMRYPNHHVLIQVHDAVQRRGPLGILVFSLMILMTCILISQVVRGFFAPETSVSGGPTKVLIVPFMAADGTPSLDGQSVAQSLAYTWAKDPEQALTRPVQIFVVDEVVKDPETALRILQRHKADLLIWGSIQAGGDANLSSLVPQLLWLPRTDLWFERHPRLQDRLALPPVYSLAFRPINGAAVLGDVIDIVDLMRDSQPDAALQQINAVIDRYADRGDLRADLFYGLRGTISLMQDQPQLAEADFRRALDVVSNARPEYWNDLAVALMFQGRDAEALEALNTALDLADGRLYQGFYNRGLLMQSAEDPSLAVPEFAQALKLQPTGVALWLHLAEAYLDVNQIDQAAAALQKAQELDPGFPLVPLVQSKVELAQLLGVGYHMDWELEITPPIPRPPLMVIRERLDAAIVYLEQLAVANRQQAASSDAAGFTERGRVYESRAATYEEWLVVTRYWHAMILIEEGVAEIRERPGGVRGLWNSVFGDDPPLEVALNSLQGMVNQEPSQYEYEYLLGRTAFLMRAQKVAEEHFRAAIDLDSLRPEAWYGLAKIYQSQPVSPERDATVRDALNQALAANPRFGPAYLLQARFEIEQENWQAALPPLVWLVENRPDLNNSRLSLGAVYRELGLLAEAEQMLLPLANAGDALALVELAKVYHAAQKPDVAEKVLLRALDVNPQNALAAYELGLIYQEQTLFAEAEQSYLRAIDIDDNFVDAHLALGRLYGQVLNRPEQAVAAYGRAIDVGATSAQNYEDLGRAFIEIGEYEQAAGALERAVALNPNVPETQHLLAQAYISLGRYDAARERERLAIASSADGVYVDAQVGIARSFRLQGRYAEAVTAFNQALDSDPTFTDAYVGLGRTAADQGDWQTAIGFYNQALNYDPNDPQAHLALGQALLEQGFYARSLQEFEQVVQVESTNPDAFYGAGRAYNQLAALELDQSKRAEYQVAARSMLNNALNFRPSFGLALLERGMLNEQEQKLDAAVVDYDQAMRLMPTNGSAPFLLGKLYMSLNRVQEASDALQLAVARDDTNASAYYWLGRSYRVSQNSAGALQNFDQALALNAGLVEARYYKGLTLEETNQPALARAEYDVVLAQTTPDSVWFQQTQERLRELKVSP